MGSGGIYASMGSGGMRGFCMVIAVVVISVQLGGRGVEGQVHHVVGGDRGWDPSSDVSSWSSGRIFRVGDKIWFAYSAAQESVVEVGSREEFLSCDTNNPIKMYTDGLEGVSLNEEGTHYFTSGTPESCKNGLKLHVDVLPPQPKQEIQTIATSDLVAVAVAVGPTPSASPHPKAVGVSSLLWFGMALLYF